MKVFKKMALVALLAATTQSFASEVMSSSGALLGPAVREIGELVPMSTSELASVQGGTYWAPLGVEQIVMSIIGGVAFAVGGSPGLYINVGPVNHSGGKVVDHMICSTLPKVATAMLTQSQLSAIKKDDRGVGYSDMAIGLTYGIGFQLLATGCHYAASAIDQVILVKKQLDEIDAIKGRRLLAITDTKSRKMLTDKWEKHDLWVKWALDNAVIQRDDVEKYTAIEEQTQREFGFCFNAGSGASYAQCNIQLTKKLNSVKNTIELRMDELKKALEQVGLAQRDHALSLGIFNRELFNNHIKLIYEIN